MSNAAPDQEHQPAPSLPTPVTTTAPQSSDMSPMPEGRWTTWVSKNRLIWLLVVVVFSVFVDQTSKIWAQENLAVMRTVNVTKEIDGAKRKVPAQKFVATEPLVLIPDALQFTYAENPAAAFSLTRSIPEDVRRPLLLISSSFGILVMIVWHLRMRRPDAILLTAFPLMVGGAVGNLIDRVRLRYVIDFIDMYAGFINPSWRHFATYNVADMCVVFGAALIIYRTFRPIYPEHDETQAQILQTQATILS